MTKDFEHCFLCGKQAEQWHHVMNKSYKKKSEKYGLLVPLCAKCHAKVHDSDESLNKELKKALENALFHRRSSTHRTASGEALHRHRIRLHYSVLPSCQSPRSAARIPHGI